MHALDTSKNISVSASAGSGKTYLLVSRLLRLLLEGVTPSSVVAVTFTRKAAGEMYERLNERLYDLASISQSDLTTELTAIGLDDSYSDKARSLYETQLLSHEKIKITTFHAFCHDLLQRFPLEADVPPGFELLESSTLLKHQAWQRLLQASTQEQNHPLNQHFNQLFEECSSSTSVERLLLDDFLEHRSDWWAFTQGQNKPIEFAYQSIRKTLQLEYLSIENALKDQAITFDEELRIELLEFRSLLLKHNTKTNSQFAEQLEQALKPEITKLNELKQLQSVFFTTGGSLRARKESKTQAAKMGESGQARFLSLHQSLADKVATLLDKHNRELTARFNLSWLTIGLELLNNFQQLKQEQQCLDFADLEWKVYQLLSDQEQSTWVQYKLDQRINHILIDEFQDTNPTQWQMLYPLLEEITSVNNNIERKRSLFIVGDSKQSIYRFRRAEPALFSACQHWLDQRQSQHQSINLNHSWRSSPAVIDFVNQVFSTSELANKLSQFEPHDTHRENLSGHTEILPLIPIPTSEEDEEEAEEDIILRNPLETPREIECDDRYAAEGEQIANTIKNLIEEKTLVTADGASRPANYGDVMILVKRRTHVGDYEQALLAQNIPFIGTQKKSLLGTLEIQDMIQLCNTLLTPHSNLALAVVLRSPLFSCSDNDLMTLAIYVKEHNVSWFSALEALAENSDSLSTKLATAYQSIKYWQSLAGTLPVHDLLDRIYHEGGIITRYIQAFPKHLKNRVSTNLIRFIELALEIDSGRYPSLQKFIYRLELLSQRDESPDEAKANENQDAVRILTIHSAKGLEAPIVILADATNQERRHARHKTLIDWPASNDKPSHFLISSMHRNTLCDKLIDQDNIKSDNEEANLLYVALTRAKQKLYISGVETRKGRWQDSWYGQMAHQLDNDFDYEHGWQSTYEGTQLNTTPAPTETFKQPTLLAIPPKLSIQNEATNEKKNKLDREAAEYGEAVHRYLELLTSERLSPSTSIDDALRHFTLSSNNSINLSACWQEALAAFIEPSLQSIFDNQNYDIAYNELPIQVMDNHHLYGIVDRLVLKTDEAIIIDYKSGQQDSDNLHEAAELHRQQLSRYRQAVKTLWPDRQVRAAIVFTAHRQMIELDF